MRLLHSRQRGPRALENIQFRTGSGCFPAAAFLLGGDVIGLRRQIVQQVIVYRFKLTRQHSRSLRVYGLFHAFPPQVCDAIEISEDYLN